MAVVESVTALYGLILYIKQITLDVYWTLHHLDKTENQTAYAVTNAKFVSS